MRTRTAVVAIVVAGALGASVTAAVAATSGRGDSSTAAMQDMRELHDQMWVEDADEMAGHMAGAEDMDGSTDTGAHTDDVGTGRGHLHDH